MIVPINRVHYETVRFTGARANERRHVAVLEYYNTGRMRIVLPCFVVPEDKSSMMRGSISNADLKLSEAALHT